MKRQVLILKKNVKVQCVYQCFLFLILGPRTDYLREHLAGELEFSWHIRDFKIRDATAVRRGPEVNFQRGDILRMLTPSS